MVPVPLELLALPSNSLEWAALVVAVLLALPYLPILGYTVYQTVSIWQTDPVDVGSSPTGELVELEGTVESLGQTLPAPLTERDVVAYSMKVERDTGQRDFEDMRESWSDVVPFYVTDATGRALVDPENPNVHHPDETTSYLSEEKRPPDPLRRRLEPNMSETPWPSSGPTASLSDSSLFMGVTFKEVTFEEQRLEPGQEVHVRARAKHPAETSYDGGAPIDPRIVLGEGERGQFTITGGDERSRLREQIHQVVALVVIGFFLFASLLQYALL